METHVDKTKVVSHLNANIRAPYSQACGLQPSQLGNQHTGLVNMWVFIELLLKENTNYSVLYRKI